MDKANYIRVTEVLGIYVDFSKIKPDVLDFATDRGSRVHALTAGYAQDVWIPEIPEYCKGYFDSFTGWFDKHVVRVIYVEERFYNNVYFYAGQPDFILEMRSEGIVLIDEKTPQTHYPTWAGQLAAYLNLEIAKPEERLAYSGYPHQLLIIDKGGSLQLDPHGKNARMNWYKESAEDYAQFLHALSAYRYFTERR